jgi:NitT/TauT family transport system substrate-binding protein
VAPLWYGMQKGLFAAEGITVQTAVAQGGAAIVPSVLSGDYQFGFGNVVSLMLAREKQAAVQIVVNDVNGAETADRGTNALMVAPGRGIESLKDMAGRKVAVTTLKNLGEVTVKATLRNAGVDISGIQFVELGFPDMNGALQNGTVDVAWQAEPFITLGQDAGLKSLADPMFSTKPGMTIAPWFASEDYLTANPDVARRFKSALTRSIDEARKDEAGVRAVIAANTKTPPPAVPRIALANWQAEPDTASLELVGRLADEFGILEGPPDLGALVWKG